MLTLLLSSIALAAPCDQPVSPAQLGARVDDAMLSWATLDEDGFATIAEQVKADVACLSGVLSPEQAASVHRVQGLYDFLQGDAEAAEVAFRAAAAAQPDYLMSDKIAPEGGKLWRLYDAARGAGKAKGTPFAVPTGYTGLIDGSPGGVLPADRAALAQVSPGEDAASWSAYILPGDPVDLSGLPKRSAPVADLDGPADRSPKAAPSGGGKGLWVAAAGAGVGAAALFGTSAVLRGSFDDAPSQGKFSAINGTYFASLGLTAAAGGLATAAIVSR